MLATVATADIASTARNKYSVFIYSKAEPHAMYAIYKHTLTLCVLQYNTHALTGEPDRARDYHKTHTLRYIAHAARRADRESRQSRT